MRSNGSLLVERVSGVVLGCVMLLMSFRIDGSVMLNKFMVFVKM